MIFYFTGTGNSLAVARALARRLEDEALSIPRELARARISFPKLGPGGVEEAARLKPLHYEAPTIIFVVPVYGHELPRMVNLFLESATFETEYLAFVLTYGNRTGDVVDYVNRRCERNGLAPQYIEALLMVDNWLPDYDIEEQLARDKGTDVALEAIMDDLTDRRHYLRPVTEADRAAHQELVSLGFSFEPWDIQDFLTVSDRCVSCGLCLQVCPAGCLTMGPDRAIRGALSGWGCTACLACINCCPSFAFDCSAGEKNPKRHYRNAEVSIADIIMANIQLT